MTHNKPVTLESLNDRLTAAKGASKERRSDEATHILWGIKKLMLGATEEEAISFKSLADRMFRELLDQKPVSDAVWNEYSAKWRKGIK